ncbi:MAG: hypothetical protein LQ351_006495 [Letrouitia transgressa]|nr:MAG: hypothetical protein LQ351_006495 [Letrouitia transgressa]
MASIIQPDAYIAPLHISKDAPTTSRNNSRSSQKTLTGTIQTNTSQDQGQITPPLTPQTSQEYINENAGMAQASFHTYLRAFFPYHPTRDESTSTITLPLNSGDIVLVHSVHTNGWADGTLLSSGARGWLPTNYCEAYNHETIRPLLKALTKFWDLAKGGSVNVLDTLVNQDYVRGIVAGVRCLLESTSCLTRESSIVQSHRGLRRNRKALLSDLSSFVKCARSLEGVAIEDKPSGVIESTVDDIIMKAFKMVIRGIKFLDIWNDDLLLAQRIDLAQTNSQVPPTPPAETTVFGNVHAHEQAEPEPAGAAMTCHSTVLPAANNHVEHARAQSSVIRPTCSRASRSAIRSGSTEPFTKDYNRQSVTHRLSISGNIAAVSDANLASARLHASHDAFLGVLGSFIGLHLQSRSSSDLLLTTQQSVISCQSMLRVVEDVFERDQRRSSLLKGARESMYNRIYDLVDAARDIFRPERTVEDVDCLVPTESKALVEAATACVRSAGECVTESRYVLEQIGDFVFEPLGFDVAASATDNLSTVEENTSAPTEPAAVEMIPQPTYRPPPPPSNAIPEQVSVSEDMPAHTTSSDLTVVTEQPGANASCSLKPTLLPPFPTVTGPLPSQEDYSPSVQSVGESHGDSPAAESLDVYSSFGSGSTCIGSLRESESSAVSQTSTRATSPDHTFGIASLSDSFSTGQSTFPEDCDDGEVKVLEKTFAHELLFNKDGQISGGTLAALIERLTIYDSTPDATFVSTFYLTFRLFATPLEFAQALIDRFQYIGESPRVAGPVRLRVYNIFKGWLESHWRNDCDSPALEIILPFASRQLQLILPTAGKRLVALVEKVNSTSGPLVPRLISSIGKTNTSIAIYVAPDTPLPAPSITKHQLNLLKNWKQNGGTLNILDFDPLELARQFTLKVSQIFCSILPEELLATEWTKKSSSLAVNVRAMSRLSTDLANLVADSVLQLGDPKKRAIIIKQWVKIAKKCLKLENYDSLMAIICSLNSSTILRLKLTWDHISSKTKAKLEMLKEVVDVSRNYAVLRQRLQNTVPPCLPFVGTYLTDLTFVDVGNQTTRQLSGEKDEQSVPVINFDKHMKTAKIISELQRFQIPYRFTEVPELQTWIQDQLVRVRSSDQTNVQNYYRRSLLLEPRETQRMH